MIYFLVNEIEGAYLAGAEYCADKWAVLDAMARAYPNAAIVLTVGEDGVVFRQGSQVLSHGIYRVKAVDTTAAGDTFCGYFLAGIAEGLPVETCLERASMASAISVSRKGAARRVLNFKACMECLPEGFKAMVPAILILTFAWTLQAMTNSLGADVFVDGLVRQSAGAVMNLLPAVVFLVGCCLAFATGTSWATFGILIPIVVEALSKTDPGLMIIAISACMAGAVCGDHCSPISDTTIMASAGARCDHVNHVSTQLPYAMTVAAISFVTYILAGFVRNAWICLPVGAALVIGVLLFSRSRDKKRAAE